MDAAVSPLCKTQLQVDGLDCPNCIAKVETALCRLSGFRALRAIPGDSTATVEHDQVLDANTIAATFSELGYHARPLTTPAAPAAGCCCCHADADQPAAETERHPWWRQPATYWLAASAFAVATAASSGQWWPAAQPSLYWLAMALGLIPVARQAWRAMRHGTWLSIETLMGLAVLAAVVVGAVAEAAVLLLLYQIGEALERLAARRSQAGIEALVALLPKSARREGSDGTVETLPSERLRVGDQILVRPGESIPADGEIIDGQGSVDESPITGESRPIAKRPGLTVLAGTLNNDALLRVRVTSAPADSGIARIVRLVREAQQRKAPVARFIERFARVYTPLVVVFAALVAVLPPLLLGASWSEWLYRAAAILLIGCPCALVISTPAAIAAGLAAGARQGLLVKSGAVLEQLRAIRTVAFDKTGTLTVGRPRVTALIPLTDNAASSDADRADAHAETRLLTLAGALARDSIHPLAVAIAEQARAQGLSLPTANEVVAIPGAGTRGRVNGQTVFLGSVAAASECLEVAAAEREVFATQAARLHAHGYSVSALISNGQPLGLIALQDRPRADAIAGVRALNQLGIYTLMLSGDQQAAATAIGRELGIEVQGELTPADKLRIVRELRAGGRPVAVVGDGINDAPALAGADVGIAMGAAAEVALETAGAACLHGRVGDVAAMIALSRKTLANIHQNVAIALGLKGLLMVTTLAGLTGLWPAILADTGATVLVTLNALRLLRTRSEQQGFEETATQATAVGHGERSEGQ